MQVNSVRLPWLLALVHLTEMFFSWLFFLAPFFKVLGFEIGTANIAFKFLEELFIEFE